MNLTLFFGTFNPIHIAHLIIAESVRDYLQSEKIMFIPAYDPPHRNRYLASAEHRLNMVKLAIADNPAFELNDIEFKRSGKSYSYLTIKDIIEQNPDLKGKPNFIIGADAFKLIDTWYEAQKLAELVNFVILSRPHNPELDKIISKVEIKNFDYEIVECAMMDLSSTFIRKRLREDRTIRYLVTEPVEKYILSNNLYRANE